MPFILGNFASSTLTAGLASGATGVGAVTVANGAAFPSFSGSDYTYLVLEDAALNREIVKVNARSGNAMDIPVGGRGLDGTTTRTWNTGDIVSLRYLRKMKLDHDTEGHAASVISNTPAGNIAATTVQAAIDELDAEKTTVKTTQEGEANFAVAGGTVQDMTATYSPSPELVDGMEFRVRALGSNTISSSSATVTMTIASPCVITWTANDLYEDQPIVLTTDGALATGLTAGQTIYVLNRVGDTFNVASTAGGTAINTSGTQSGTHTASAATYTLTAPTFDPVGVSATVTMTSASPCVVTHTAHGRVADEPVILTTTGALYTGLTAGQTVYIKSPTTDNYNLSATPGGAAINTSGTQSGFHTATIGKHTVYKQGGQALGKKDIFGAGHEIALRFRQYPARYELIATTTDLLGKEEIAVFPAGAMKPQLTSGCALLVWDESTTYKVMTSYLAFDAATQEYAQFSFRAPKALDESANFTAMFVWKEAASATVHNCVWQIEMQAQGDGDTLDSAWGTAVTVTDTGASGIRQISPETSAIVPGGTWAAGDEIIVRVSRKAADAADTLDVDAHLIEVVLFATYAASVEP